VGTETPRRRTLAAGNNPKLQTVESLGVNVYDLLKYDQVVFSKEADPGPPGSGEAMTKIFEVIRKPLLTEKGQILRENNIQVFEVATWASKHQIKEAVELLLQAKVKSIRTVRIPAKDQAPGPLDGHHRPPQEGLHRTRRGPPAAE
jgi:large subunit ribosomal protein L23